MEAKKYKGALCPGCGADVAVATLPEAEINKDEIKTFRDYAIKGYEIVIRPLSQMNFGCTCEKVEKTIDKDQLSLF